MKETMSPPLGCSYVARTVGSAHKCNKKTPRKQEIHIKFIAPIMRIIGSYYGSCYARKGNFRPANMDCDYHDAT